MVNEIGFPGLGFSFSINPVAFTVMGKPIYWYGIIIAAGFFLALLFVTKTCKKRGVQPDTIYDVAIYGLIFGILGARIYYILFDFDSVRGSIWNFFKVWNGGIAIYGGIIGAAISTVIYCRRKKLPTLKVFDVCAPGLLIGQIIGRFGNFVNAEVYGGETALPWRMSINQSAGVHPLFLYESIWNLIGLIIILFVRDKKKADGEIFFLYTLWYALGRLWMEGMRQSEYILYLIPGRIGISQVVSFLVIVSSAIFLVFLHRNSKKTGEM
jgi:phosphatidylglycerol:prolipoprotein diacylglycerol transferase